ncbi:MAG: hypothetical protein V3T19_04100, partial [Acidiferrobacterales bacterium]
SLHAVQAFEYVFRSLLARLANTGTYSRVHTSGRGCEHCVRPWSGISVLPPLDEQLAAHED